MKDSIVVSHLIDPEEYLKFVENYRPLAKGEQKYWGEIEPIISAMLDELKTNNKLETVFIPSKIEHMKNLMYNIYEAGTINNCLVNVFYPIENYNEFIKNASKFDFDDKSMVSLFIGSFVLSCILHTEMFKTLILFHSKDVDTKVSLFPRTMEKIAPKTWKQLEPYVNSDFRNSLAH